jgi:hypothetical protein
MAKKNADSKTEAQTDAQTTDTPPADPIRVKPGTVVFASRYEELRLTMDPGGKDKPFEVVQFVNGRADIADKALVERMRKHPLLGVDFHEIAAA